MTWKNYGLIKCFKLIEFFCILLSFFLDFWISFFKCMFGTLCTTCTSTGYVFKLIVQLTIKKAYPQGIHQISSWSVLCKEKPLRLCLKTFFLIIFKGSTYSEGSRTTNFWLERQRLSHFTSDFIDVLDRNPAIFCEKFSAFLKNDSCCFFHFEN